jgi:hypothetical protein
LIELAVESMTDPVEVHKPPVPIMGGIAQTEHNKWVAWSGGAPNLGWTEFESLITDYTTPNQLRSVYDVKGYNHSKTGLTDKFNKTDMLLPFKKLVWNHLKDNGLDTITYLPDMRKTMSCVIYDHSRYTLESVRKSSVTQAAKYDKYDATNNTAAVAFLLDSLSPALAAVITERLEEQDSFHVVWLELMNEIQVQTIERIEAIKKQIQGRRPQQYPAQDLEKMAVDFRADALELVNAGQYEHNLTLSMLKSYLLAGGMDNEDYRFGLRLLKLKLDEELLSIGYMDKTHADSHMTAQGLGYKDVIAGAIKPYRKQLDRNEWPPAKNQTDAKSVPTNFGANLAVNDVAGPTDAFCGTQAEVLLMLQAAKPANDPIKTWTHGEVLALIKSEQQGGGGSNKSGACHNCGVVGHWSRECPKPRQGTGTRPSGPPHWK